MPDNIEEILKALGVPEKYSQTCGLDQPIPGSITVLTKQGFVDMVKPYGDLVIIVVPGLYEKIKDIPGNYYIQTANARVLFLKIHNLINAKKHNVSIGCEGKIHPSVVIGTDSYFEGNITIMPNCVIGSNVRIGEGTIIQPNTTICNETLIGKNCLIGPNVSLGEDGFRIIKDENKNSQRLAHIGKLIIGDGVHIGASSTVNRGTFRHTIISDFVKIDNQVHVGHNIEIGKNSIICASSCIGGSTTIGENCWIGIGSTVRNGLKIGKNVNIDINGVVVKDVEDGGHVAGFYAKAKLSWMMKEKDEMKKYRLK